MATRIVYTDLDGTMVGPRGSFWHTADRELTASPAAALLELHRAGVALVLVSGRTHAQLLEAGRIFAVDGAIAELGSLVSWHGGRETHLLTGDLPEQFAGRTPMDVLAELGIVDALVAAHRGRLEWHEPWHATHSADALLRGRVDAAAVDVWLAERGWGWLTLNDNGAVPATARMTLDAEALPPHVYHLMPRGISKGAAITWDLARRGLNASDAVAVGDSVSDLEMAPAVGRLWVTANGAAVDGMAARLDAVPNAVVTDAPMGEGWAQAVLASLG
ncbi:HAD hydrolase family protein [Modestobacter sp. VKM Ac-2979]|uniref:HAD family hydrolase n=1 Tax=unclassified Modestobacter TaxID=2643866 RepID=UPI0022AB9BC9|nr:MULTISPECIES: HAD hydrolase family protein [unclassified Modestobacter]MCZ2810620.1 HAD hydrolase family protein [Modestobacter sp. VKM Ac-2979]MCZ2842106.1 HAD hydrolase family protein [Modestobacter sp. VKM Ac-2980]